ncbi:hypothetical protein ACWC2K_17750 [Streptomyces chattanoogensis]|uniref:hypothetical protein n=1 Tax=Streptomyces chattanoogensis TaxID=66876 RepID=UPI0036A9B813
MSTWQRIVRTSDGLPTPADLVWFADDPAADETWGYGYPVPDAEERAAHAWAATAHTAAKAAGQEDIQVLGVGLLARLVRLALPDDTDPGSLPQPGAVIETTGTTAGIKSALATVRPGGLVLLAARPLHASTPLPTYQGIHLPGIRVLPVPWCDGVNDAPAYLVAGFLRSATPLSGRRGGG